MHALADLLVGNIKRTLAVWTRDDHLFPQVEAQIALALTSNT
jgi:hypothetical protein